MKRRTMLKGAAALAAGSTILSGTAEVEAMVDDKRMFARFTLSLPGPYEKLPEQLQEGVDGLRKEYPELTPSGLGLKIEFEPVKADGTPWLVHPAWESDPASIDNERTLHAVAHEVIGGKRWDIVQRAVDLRLNAYYRLENTPPWRDMRVKLVEWQQGLREWKQEQLTELAAVHVSFMALVNRPTEA